MRAVIDDSITYKGEKENKQKATQKIKSAGVKIIQHHLPLCLLVVESRYERIARTIKAVRRSVCPPQTKVRAEWEFIFK